MSGSLPSSTAIGRDAVTTVSPRRPCSALASSSVVVPTSMMTVSPSLTRPAAAAPMAALAALAVVGPHGERRLVGAADHRDRAAAYPAGEAVGLERLQVAPDRHLRDAELLGQLGEPDLAAGGQPAEHGLPAL